MLALRREGETAAGGRLLEDVECRKGWGGLAGSGEEGEQSMWRLTGEEAGEETEREEEEGPGERRRESSAPGDGEGEAGSGGTASQAT